MGHPLEVTYPLDGPLPAGSYHLVGDGVLFHAPRVRYELSRRRGGADDLPVISFEHKFPDAMAAQYEETRAGLAVDARRGDLLVLQVSLVGDTDDASWIPISEHPPTPTARFLTVDIP